MNYNDFITNTCYLLLIINTLVFTISYNSKNKASKYFIMYLILCLFVQLFSSILSDLRQNNLYLFHYFITGQFIFLSLLFSKLQEFKKIKKLIRSLAFVIALSIILYFYKTPDALNKWNVLEISLTSIPLLIYSFLFFVKKISNDKDKKYIYFNSGFFVYTLCSTLIFSVGNIGTRTLKLYVWDINNILYIIFQILIFVEWYKNFKPSFKKRT